MTIPGIRAKTCHQKRLNWAIGVPICGEQDGVILTLVGGAAGPASLPEALTKRLRTSTRGTRVPGMGGGTGSTLTPSLSPPRVLSPLPSLSGEAEAGGDLYYGAEARAVSLLLSPPQVLSVDNTYIRHPPSALSPGNRHLQSL